MNLRFLLPLIAVFALATPAAAQITNERPIVIGQAFDMPSKAEGETRHVTVWLPPAYRPDRADRFPVLFLLDGGEGQDLLPVVGLAQLSWLNSVTADYIVVGIESGRGLRIRDFTTPSELERKEFPVQGEAARFRRFLADELKPLIAARYRTSGETAVMGESLAGYFIVDTFLKQPDLFSSYIAVSPSLWWDGQSLTKQADALLAAPGRPAGRKLYLTVGNEGPIAAEAMGRLLAALKTHPAGVDVLYDPLPEEEHRSIYHPAGLRALRWALPGPEALKK